MRYEQRKTLCLWGCVNVKMWENSVDNVDNLVYNLFLAENQEFCLWMYFSWILWIKWIICGSNIFFVQCDRSSIITQ